MTKHNEVLHKKLAEVDNLIDNQQLNEAEEFLNAIPQESRDLWFSIYEGKLKIFLQKYDEAFNIFTLQVLPKIENLDAEMKDAVFSFLFQCSCSKGDYKQAAEWNQASITQIHQSNKSNQTEQLFVNYSGLFLCYFNLNDTVKMRQTIDCLKLYCKTEEEWFEYYFTETAYHSAIKEYQRALEFAVDGLQLLQRELNRHYRMGSLLIHICYSCTKLKFFDTAKQVVKGIKSIYPDLDLRACRLPLIILTKKHHPIEAELIKELKKLEIL